MRYVNIKSTTLKHDFSEKKEGSVMIDIKLSDSEQELLTHLITKELEETHLEIHHTKNNDFKQYLRERETTLKNIVSMLK